LTQPEYIASESHAMNPDHTAILATIVIVAILAVLTMRYA
jgi:hypothetical protein